MIKNTHEDRRNFRSLNDDTIRDTTEPRVGQHTRHSAMLMRHGRRQAADVRVDHVADTGGADPVLELPPAGPQTHLWELIGSQTTIAKAPQHGIAQSHGIGFAVTWEE